MKTILTMSILTLTHEFSDIMTSLTKVSEVGFKIDSELIQVQVPDDEVDFALEILSGNINVEN